MNDVIFSMVNYRNELHYLIQDKTTGFTYAVYLKLSNGYIAGMIHTAITPHVETVYNNGRAIRYYKGDYMYSNLLSIIDTHLKL